MEALVYELGRINVPIKKAEVGPVSKRDFTEASTNAVPENKIIIAFNVPVDVKDFQDVKVIENRVIYSIKDDLLKAREEIRQKEVEEKRKAMTFPCKLLVMEGNVFRISKPAIFGVRVLGGKLRSRTQLMKIDGSSVGPVKSIRTGEQSLEEASQGEEVAIAMDGITVGRQIKEGDVLYSDINERDFRLLKEENLNVDENMIMEEIKSLRRKTSPFWGS